MKPVWKTLYNLAKVSTISLAVFACSKPEPDIPVPPVPPKPTKDTVAFNLKSIADFNSNMNIASNKDKIYNALVFQDISTDSVELVKTLVEWKNMDTAALNLDTDWKDKGIFVPRDSIVYPFGKFQAAGSPKIKPNPQNGMMPYSENEADSIEYKKSGYALNIMRRFPVGPVAPGVYNISSIEALRANLPIMQSDNSSFVINLSGTLNLANADIETLRAAFELFSNPRVQLNGNVNVAPMSDSVEMPQPLMTALKGFDGKIIRNGNNSFFVGDLTDFEILSSVLQSPATVRTKVSKDFANLDKAIPNTIEVTKSHDDKFSENIKSLPQRTGWNNGKYILVTNNLPLVVTDESALARIAQPSVRGTAQYPKPDVWTSENPNYAEIFTTVYSDSVGYAMRQRVWGAGGVTKIRTHDVSSQGRDIKIMHYTDADYSIKVSPDGKAPIDVTLVNVDKFALPLEHPIYAPFKDLVAFPYELDMKNYCFIIPDSVAATFNTEGTAQANAENDEKVIRLIEGNGYTTMINRYVAMSGRGALPNGKSFFWITRTEFEKIRQEQGKKCR